MYHRMLERPDLMEEYGAPGVPRWERAGLPMMLPLMRKLIVRRTDADDEHAAAARERVREEFDEVAARLSDGRPYLCGDALQRRRPRVRRARGGRARARRATASRCRRSTSCPEPYGDEVQAMREHPAGRFALRLYDQERP